MSGSPDGVRLKFFIDGSPFQEETQGGMSGSWSFLDNFDVPGSHTYKVEACPTTISGGVTTVCLAHCSSTQVGFTTRPEVGIGCVQDSSTNLTCTGTLQVATQAPYTCHWKEGSGSWYSKTCWEEPFTCKQTTPHYAIYFKVTDANGKESNVAVDGCYGGT